MSVLSIEGLRTHFFTRAGVVKAVDGIDFSLERGEVMDQGTHAELLERGGIYADLYRLQFQDGKTLVERKEVATKVPASADQTEDDSGPFRRLLRRIFVGSTANKG